MLINNGTADGAPPTFLPRINNTHKAQSTGLACTPNIKRAGSRQPHVAGVLLVLTSGSAAVSHDQPTGLAVTNSVAIGNSY
jgi:hypothetical protein